MSIDGGTGLAALGLSTTGSLQAQTASSRSTASPTPSHRAARRKQQRRPQQHRRHDHRIVLRWTSRWYGHSPNIDLGDGQALDARRQHQCSDAGITAAAVQVGTNQYKLQLQSTTTGSAGHISTNFDAFDNTLGKIQTVACGTRRQLQIGTGANAYTITSSSSNTVSNVLPGVTVNATSADPNKTITVNIRGDVTGLEAKVQTLVNAVNDALSYITNELQLRHEHKTRGCAAGQLQGREPPEPDSPAS